MLTTGGCIEIDSSDGPPTPDPKFRLMSLELPAGLGGLVVDPLEVEANYEIDYSEAYKRAKLDELVGSGSVSVRGWPVTWRSIWGDGHRDKRRVLHYDSTYYRLHVAEEAVDVPRERQVLFLDWTADAPDDGDDVRTRPVESLSERDRELVDAAVESVPASGRRLGDPVEYGVVFHDDLDAEESDLVPEPPFDYLEGGWDTFAVRAGTIDHERTEWTYSVEAVAEDLAGYEEYVRDTFPDAIVPYAELSGGAREVLDAATDFDGGDYEEDPPLSEDLEEVLEHLGIADQLRPHEEYEERTAFENLIAEYRGRWYKFDLLIYP